MRRCTRPEAATVGAIHESPAHKPPLPKGGPQRRALLGGTLGRGDTLRFPSPCRGDLRSPHHKRKRGGQRPPLRRVESPVSPCRGWRPRQPVRNKNKNNKKVRRIRIICEFAEPFCVRICCAGDRKGVGRLYGGAGSRDLIRRFAPPSPCAGKALAGGDGAAASDCHPEEAKPTKDLDGAGQDEWQYPDKPSLRRGARSFDSGFAFAKP